MTTLIPCANGCGRPAREVGQPADCPDCGKALCEWCCNARKAQHAEPRTPPPLPPAPLHRSPRTTGARKGRDRNQPCACGSGDKAKRCRRCHAESVRQIEVRAEEHRQFQADHEAARRRLGYPPTIAPRIAAVVRAPR